jgi:hypothetical protein
MRPYTPVAGDRISAFEAGNRAHFDGAANEHVSSIAMRLQDNRRARAVASRLRRARALIEQAAVIARGDQDQDCALMIDSVLALLADAQSLAARE